MAAPVQIKMSALTIRHSYESQIRETNHNYNEIQLDLPIKLNPCITDTLMSIWLTQMDTINLYLAVTQQAEVNYLVLCAVWNSRAMTTLELWSMSG